MIKRIIDISEPAYLRLKQAQLLVERDGVIISTLPVEDLGVLILQHSGIVVTQAVLVACQENNAVVVFCNARHLPYSVLLPIVEGNSLHSKIIREQISTPKTAFKRLWKQIVVQKIKQQAEVLETHNKNSLPVKRLAAQVKSGDSENHEAQAAQKYWRLLFGEAFRRDKDREGINALLNYGYAILRAATARAIVSGGLHPALGVHHHNQYNGLCLADDLMEPLRPMVDQEVYQLFTENSNIEIDQDSKKILLGLLSRSVEINHKSMPLMVALHYLVADFKRALTARKVQLKYPQAV